MDYTEDWTLADLRSQVRVAQAEAARMERLNDGLRELLRKEREEKALLVEQVKETLKQVEETTEVLRQINRYR